MRSEAFRNLTSRERSKSIVVMAFFITALTLWIGYSAFGFLTSLIFSFGFFGGFILWCIFDSNTPYEKLKAPYLTCLILFLVHRLEEKFFGFFEFLSKVTKNPTPETTSWSVISLVAISVGAWLATPLLLKRGFEIGYYFAWTFFAAMGITELAHWVVFPFLLEQPLQYVPGMISVLPLVPAAWWGMKRLYNGSNGRRLHP